MDPEQSLLTYPEVTNEGKAIFMTMMMLKKMVFKYFCVGRQPFSSGTPPAVPSFSVFVNVDQDF